MKNINIHPSWNEFLNKENVKEEMNKIDNFLNDELYFPRNENVYKFLEMDKNNIKVVILGMEPYPSFYTNKQGNKLPVATGRSFEVANVDNWSQKFKQSSLRNILKAIYFASKNEIISLDEIRKKINNNTFNIKQPHDWFNSLQNQGVLFLNASLTVRQGKVKTHTKVWESFMNLLINEINNDNVVWMVWGKDALERIKKFNLISDFKSISQQNIHYTCHPRLAQFVNENPFGKVNNINWLG